jgi:hypothetical protein
MKRFFTMILLSLALMNTFAKKNEKAAPDNKIYDLAVAQDDILVLPEDENHLVMDGRGVHLFVKKRGDIQSVALLVKSKNYNDPDLSLMRAKVFNSVNGNEIRYSYGLKSSFRMERLPNALISSTVENSFFGDCFHIYLPEKMYYGYVIQKQDECDFEDGMTVNIRAFSEKYCDNAGKICDNFLSLNISDWQTEESFAKIAGDSAGKVLHIIRVSDLSQKLLDEIAEINPEEKNDLVFALDATDSMKDDFIEMKKNWLSKFEKQMKKFEDVKIGLLFYKDYGDDFNTKGLPVKNLGFLKDAKSFSKSIKNISVRGGGDREEAVYEALYSCAADFDWREDSKRKIILIGDAPPHLNPEKNKFLHQADEISDLLQEKKITVDCILISDSKNSEKNKSGEKTTAPEKSNSSVPMIDAK